jgi:hypothetical protein
MVDWMKRKKKAKAISKRKCRGPSCKSKDSKVRKLKRLANIRKKK